MAAMAALSGLTINADGLFSSESGHLFGERSSE
jgi:hypothetical protein